MDINLSDTAYDYLGEELNPLPLKMDKSPKLPIGHRYLYELMDTGDVERLFAPAEKIGIACGKVSGNFECLDFDGKDGEPVAEIFDKFMSAEVVQAVMAEHDLPCFTTPSGGKHIYYRYEADPDTTHPPRKLAHWQSGKVMIETRGNGAYVAVHPSPGYVQIQGSEIIKVRRITAEQRDCLIATAESLTLSIRTAHEGKSRTESVRSWPDKFDTSNVWGRYSEECADEAKQLLLDAGWKYLYTRRHDGVDCWTRPGKDTGISATFGKYHNMFYCWTDNAPPFNSETAYKPFDIFLLLSHGGDMKQATKTLYDRWRPTPDMTDKFMQPVKPPPIAAPAVTDTGTSDSPVPAGYTPDPETDPITRYNTTQHGIDHCKAVLTRHKWTVQQGSNPEIWTYKDAPVATFTGGVFTITSPPKTKAKQRFKQDHSYTPFQMLTNVKFKGNYRGAIESILYEVEGKEIPYIRVGIDYFKNITKTDRFGIERKELKKWNKEEIKLDHGDEVLKVIPHFDDFTIEPDNRNYQPIINNCYNLYKPFIHTPVPGEWTWTKVMLENIFKEQYDLGIRYLQALYLNPKHALPILVLVSKERQTGKTTFLNWIGMMFGDNVATISPENLNSEFNSSYATSNIITVEETFIEKVVTVEKLKDLATKKLITVNAKFITHYNAPFFGKIILTSNNENKFARIDQEEIRFFVRKVAAPKVKNHGIEDNIVAEIPAFLHYLTTLPPVDWSRDRSGFTPEELENEYLKNVKLHSMSATSHEIIEYATDIFNNQIPSESEFYASITDIKDEYYSKNNQCGAPWIREVLKDQLKLEYCGEKSFYYYPFGRRDKARTGRPFKFIRSQFPDTVPVKYSPSDYGESDVPF